MALLLLLLAWTIAAGAGRALLSRFTCIAEVPLERFVFSSALGLGIAAYGVYGIGLLGGLSIGRVTAWWVLLGGFGWRGIRENWRDLTQALPFFRTTQKVPKGKESKTEKSCDVFAVAALCGLAALGGLAIVGCFQSPNVHAWDALAYHLADPKLFLMQSRIVPLPTEHHSNFPFTMEMLFTVGLLYQGYVLAGLFHWLTTALTCLALVAFCGRVFSFRAGCTAALIYAATPLVFWESTISYIDLGLACYVALATFSLLSILPKQKQADLARVSVLPKAKRIWERSASEGEMRQWVWLAGIMMGFALGVKYLALVPCFALGAWLLTCRPPLRTLACYAGAATLIGLPWYVKNVVWTGNPVYPYLFKAFPHSRYWSADRAERYQGEQSSFGYAPGRSEMTQSGSETTRDQGKGHLSLGTTLRDFVLSPWRLITEPEKYQNPGNYTFTEWTCGLYAALGLSLIRFRRLPAAVNALLALSLFQIAVWFLVSQVGRYLLSILPLMAAIGGYALTGDSAVASSHVRKEAGKPSGNTPRHALPLIAAGLLFSQVFLLVWGLFLLPSGGREALQTVDLGLAPTALSLPEVIKGLSDPTLAEETLRRRLDVYNAIQWLNAHAPKGAGVVLYDEVLGYYLDRPFLWGDGEHSSYIGYEGMHDGAYLTHRLNALGVRYALINLNHSSFNAYDKRMQTGQFPAGPSGRESEALAAWYAQPDAAAPRWRQLLAEALRTGGWKLADTGDTPMHGIAIVELPASIPQRAGQ